MRLLVASETRKFAEREQKTILIVDHDLLLLDFVADRGILISGIPAKKTSASNPIKLRNALDQFLHSLGTTFRRDPLTQRPRANKPDSQKDREQKLSGKYYCPE